MNLLFCGADAVCADDYLRFHIRRIDVKHFLPLYKSKPKTTFILQKSELSCEPFKFYKKWSFWAFQGEKTASKSPESFIKLFLAD